MYATGRKRRSKYANMTREPCVSIAVAKDYPQPLDRANAHTGPRPSQGAREADRTADHPHGAAVGPVRRGSKRLSQVRA